MLVLSRKPGEKILVGDNITITIVRIGPNTVRLGIDAPRDMNIVRSELTHTELTLEVPDGVELEDIGRQIAAEGNVPIAASES